MRSLERSVDKRCWLSEAGRFQIRWEMAEGGSGNIIAMACRVLLGRWKIVSCILPWGFPNIRVDNPVTVLLFRQRIAEGCRRIRIWADFVDYVRSGKMLHHPGYWIPLSDRSPKQHIGVILTQKHLISASPFSQVRVSDARCAAGLQ